MPSLQEKISQLMTQKKINAVDLERETGINKNTVYSILSGNSKNPSAHNLQLIAGALGVSLESILTDTDNTQFDALSGGLSNEQIKAFADSAIIATNIIMKKELHPSLNKLLSLIKEVYQYSIKVDPPCVDERFADWWIDRNKN